MSRFPEKSPDSRNNFSYVPKQRLLELSPPVKEDCKARQVRGKVILLPDIDFSVDNPQNVALEASEPLDHEQENLKRKKFKNKIVVSVELLRT